MRTILIIASLLLASIVLSACGRAFDDAQSFVDAANEEGAGFVLEEELFSEDSEHPVYALSVERQGPVGTKAEGQQHVGGGSIIVTSDDDEAIAEYGRCQEAASLLCYRAGNVALRLEDALTPEERVRIDTAVSALGEQ